MSAGTTASSAPSGLRAPGAPGHPAADLRRLAARLAGSSDQERGLGDDAAGLPGPAFVREIGERFGVEIVLASRMPGQLSPGDCPAVLILKDGGSRLLLEITPDGSLLFAGRAGVPDRTTAAALETFVTGGVFMGRRTEPETMLPATSARHAEVTPGNSRAMSGSWTEQRFGPVVGALVAACVEQRPLVVSLAVAAFLSGLIGLMVPVFTMVVFDRVIPHGAFETLWALIIGVTLLLGVDLALRHVRHALGDAMSIRATRDLGGRFFSRLLHAPLAEAPRNAGGLVQPYQEMRQAAQMAPPFVAGLLVDLPFFLLTIAFMASLGNWIALIPVVGALAIFALNLGTHIASRPHAALEARLADRQNHALVEAAAAKETVQVTGAGPRLLARWEERMEAGALAGHSARGLANLAAHGGATVAQLVTVATVGAGAYAVAASDMTLGALSACMMLASRAIMPVATLMAQGFRLAQTARHSGALADILSGAPERGGDRERPVGGVRAAYALTGVGFRHGAEGRVVIDGITLKIAPGERVAVVGKSGCGKSTLLKLFARLHDATTGSIHVDGRHISQIDPLTLRRDVALMPQEPALFDTSLAANMTAGLPLVEPEWFQRVAEIAGVAEFASAHPAGFSLQVGVGGSALSGGERQAAALARALMGKPALLLLDEPTSAMDNEREARFVQMLRREMTEGALNHMGLVVATHRLPILQLADRIIWLDRGKVVADGPRDEVFRKVGVAA